MFVRYYNFHDFLTLRVTSLRRGYIKFLDREFRFFIDENPQTTEGEVDIDLYIDTEPQEKALDTETLRFTELFRKLFRVSFSITGIEHSTTTVHVKSHKIVYISPYVMGLFIQTQIIDPLMYLKCVLKDKLIAHAACISDGKSSYLLPAFGGTGKTTTSLLLANEGKVFLADDLVFVSEEGIAYGYPRPLHLFTYVLKNVSFLNLDLKTKLSIRLKNIIRTALCFLLKEEFFICTRVEVRKAMPNIKIGKSFPIKKICFLRKPGNVNNLPKISKENIGKFITLFIEMDDIHLLLFDRLLKDNSSLKQTISGKERKIVKTLLEDIDVCSYEVDSCPFENHVRNLKAMLFY